MRDPARIGPLLANLGELWSRWPDLRLGQLLSILAAEVRGDGNTDPFYVEDDDILGAVEKHLKLTQALSTGRPASNGGDSYFSEGGYLEPEDREEFDIPDDYGVRPSECDCDMYDEPPLVCSRHRSAFREARSREAAERFGFFINAEAR